MEMSSSPFSRARRHRRLVPPCAPLPAEPEALVELAPDEILVGVLLGRPYVRAVAVAIAGDAPRLPPLRAAVNLHLVDQDRLVVVDGDDRWFRDVRALHRAGGVESWLVAVHRRPASEPSALRVRRDRPTTPEERERLGRLRLHDLEALFGPTALHRRPRAHLVPSPPGR